MKLFVWEENLGPDWADEVEAPDALEAIRWVRDEKKSEWKADPRWGEKRIYLVAGADMKPFARFEIHAEPAVDFHIAITPMPRPAKPGEIPF